MNTWTNGIKLLARVWKVLLVYCLVRAGLDVGYGILMSRFERQLQGRGEIALWWSISFAYFILDLSTIVALTLYFLRKSDRSVRSFTGIYSLPNVISDLAIFIFLIHLAKLFRDPLVYPLVLSLGLTPLEIVLLLAWIGWGVIIVSRLSESSRLAALRGGG
jgi:hypothetical protein